MQLVVILYESFSSTMQFFFFNTNTQIFDSCNSNRPIFVDDTNELKKKIEPTSLWRLMNCKGRGRSLEEALRGAGGGGGEQFCCMLKIQKCPPVIHHGFATGHRSKKWKLLSGSEMIVGSVLAPLISCFRVLTVCLRSFIYLFLFFLLPLFKNCQRLFAVSYYVIPVP